MGGGVLNFEIVGESSLPLEMSTLLLKRELDIVLSEYSSL